MKRSGISYKTVILLSLLLTVILQPTAKGAVRTSVGLVGGLGVPVGWWSERWDPFLSGEINLRYEFSPGTGFLLLTGLGKSYFASLSPEEIEAESRVNDIPAEFKPYSTIDKGTQDGSFKQLPVGFGFYTERMIQTFRIYGSFAMLVNLWKVERNQQYITTVDAPNSSPFTHEDIWTDSQDGANVGAQFVLGFIYPLRKQLFLDFSVAYDYISISQKHSAIAYWGLPARTMDSDKLEEASKNVNFIQLRVGFRYGR